MRKPFVIALIAAAVIASVALGLVIKHRAAVNSSYSAMASTTIGGREYCADATLTTYNDGHSLVRLENCAGETTRLLVYNKNGNPYEDYYIKSFNFAPNGYAEFEIDTAHPQLLFTASVDGTEIPLGISLNG